MSTRSLNRTDRLAVIEQLLIRSPMGLRAVELAETCQVNRRTIYRDLTLLETAGVPLQQKDGRFFIDREHYAATVRLTFDELMALFLAARLALRDNPHVIAALDKLSAVLPVAVARHINQIRTQAEPVRTASTQILDTLTRGWAEGRRVRLWYGGDRERKPKARDVSIYFIEPTPAGALGIIGFDETAFRLRFLRLQHIQKARLLPDTYRIPVNFDPMRYIINPLGSTGVENPERVDVVLQFSDEAAQLVTDWPVSDVQIDRLDDGCCRLRLPVNDWRELAPWIRSWGSQVEVIEPRALREAFAREAAQIVALYGAEAQA